ncbi:methyltransferase domain-containing protein [Nocardia terpenica]|nr:methyltransferase domain-containing protein [Nocardia terpenica]MBF6104911.1 methyltransferase domain-containing protein [Nocardia terpenica]MBF6112652.1 methyltransferase domain-containing protein [Nocardia terpenica]MBF6118639.1 methyltransferase domain-containing protein [Nocardia terpenica]MBF6155118.1 methyltransferase domain-containing protein [Nocardia terpenica]
MSGPIPRLRAVTEPEDLRHTRDAYDGVAELYAAMFENALDDNPYDRAMLAVFAERVRDAGNGLVGDLGCGPGRITPHLAALGLNAFGMDLSPEMIRLARAAHPALRFEEGSMERLPLADGELGGILAWYSLIHTPPERVPGILGEFGRVLADGGPLLLGFQAADESHDIQPYDHKVATAYRWSLRGMEELLDAAGFRTHARMLREPDETERTQHGCLLATRSAA